MVKDDSAMISSRLSFCVDVDGGRILTLKRTCDPDKRVAAL